MLPHFLECSLVCIKPYGPAILYMAGLVKNLFLLLNTVKLTKRGLIRLRLLWRKDRYFTVILEDL